MEFLELVELRYAVREYKPDPIPVPLLDEVLEAARLAPSAHNNQPYRLIVMETAKRSNDLRRVYDRDWFVQPPLVIAIVTVTAESWERSDGKIYADVDAAIAFDHLTLAAAERGLGTCWIGAFDPDAARTVLDLPEGVEPLAFTPLGFPADEPGFKRRKPIEEVVRYGSW